MLIAVPRLGATDVLGESLDDAAGEAFDKTAKLLGLPYPGGPELARLALDGRSEAFRFPRPMLDRPGFDFSFSGLKTAVVLAVRERELDPQRRADIARGVEDAMVDTLVIKTRRALQATGLTPSWSPAASVRISACASAWPPRSRRRAHVLLPAARVLYRQCGDDRVRRPCAAGPWRTAARRSILARAQWPLATLTAPAA